MDGNVKFNLQTFLSEMRAEQQRGHRELTEKVDSIVGTVNNHETRIVVVENTRRSILWLGGTIVVGFIGGLYDLLFVHLPNHFKP